MKIMTVFGMDLSLTDLAKACGVNITSACKAMRKMTPEEYCVKHGINDFEQLRGKMEEVKSVETGRKTIDDIIHIINGESDGSPTNVKVVEGGETVSLGDLMDDGVDVLAITLANEEPDINRRMWEADAEMRETEPSRSKVLMLALNSIDDVLVDLIHYHGAEISDGLNSLLYKTHAAIEDERWKLLKDGDSIDWHAVAENMK